MRRREVWLRRQAWRQLAAPCTTMPAPAPLGKPGRPQPHIPSPALTQLVGERQCEGGLPQRALQGGPVVGAPVCELPVQLWSRQVAELPGGVGGAPALVPADAAASIQAGDLAEICNIDPKVTGRGGTQQHPPWRL